MNNQNIQGGESRPSVGATPEPRGLPTACQRLIVLLVAGVLAGCSREEIRAYDVPREAPHASKDLPEGWQQLPSDQMRIGNYAVQGKNGEKAQVTVIALPGSSGSELDNVNRWRGQVGLQPISAAEVAQ